MASPKFQLTPRRWRKSERETRLAPRPTKGLFTATLFAAAILAAACAKEEERPVSLMMSKKKWRQGEGISVTVTLNPPPEIRCLIPSIDNRFFEFRLLDERGRLLDPERPLSELSCNAERWWSLASVEREFLSRITFTVPLNGVPPDFYFYELEPGGYRLSAVYDARDVRKLLAQDPAEPLAAALRWACGIPKGPPLCGRLEDQFLWRFPMRWSEFADCGDREALMSADPLFSACWSSFNALLERIGCPPREGTFFEGPYESNVVEFKVVPGKRKDAENDS